MHPILTKLQGGDCRSIGRADEVVEDVLKATSLFKELFKGLYLDDPVIRMRTADAIEKITLKEPDLMGPYKNKLIRLAGDSSQQEVRWHMAQILPRLALTLADRKIIVDILYTYLNDKSKIVVTFALQALADFASEDNKFRSLDLPILH